MPYVDHSQTLIYKDDYEIGFNQEDLRFNYVDDTWISRWVNDSIVTGNVGSGHIEFKIIQTDDYDKIREGVRILLDDGWYNILEVEDDGTEFGSIYLDGNPPMSRIHAIHGTDFDNTSLKLSHLDPNAIYTGPPIGKYLYGSGKDGDFIEHKGTHIINDYAWLSKNAYGGQNIITVDSTEKFSAGDEILIIQTQYAENDTNYYGNFEFHYIEEVLSSTQLKLQWCLGLPFISDDPNLSIRCNPWPSCPNYCRPNPRPNCSCNPDRNSRTSQVIRVPHFRTFRLGIEAKLTARAWNGYTGGFVIFRSQERADVSGVIDVTGLGFRGSFRPPRTRFVKWESYNGGNNNYEIICYKPIFEPWSSSGGENYYGTSGEGCHGYGSYSPTNSYNGIGGAGCSYRTKQLDRYRQEPAPGSGGSFGSRGGAAFKIFREWYAVRDYYGKIIEWRYNKHYLRTPQSDIICTSDLTRMTLAPGGGGTYWRFGGAGSGGILIFSKTLHVYDTGKILCNGGLGSIGIGGDGYGGARRNDADGGHGAGGPLVLFAPELLVNEGIIDGGGASYLPGQSSRGGAGGNGRLVIDAPNYEGNLCTNFGTVHNPLTIREAVRWGKLPFNNPDTLSIPYNTYTTNINRLDVRKIRMPSRFTIDYDMPYFAQGSDIRLAISFNNHDWVVWSNGDWKTINIEELGKSGMSISTFTALRTSHFMKDNAFISGIEYIDVAAALTTGQRLDSPTISNIKLFGYARTWQIWGVKYPREIESVFISEVKSVMGHL